MKAMILAAGLGTRLKPWTLSHPKALVPVGGVPMLERVIMRLKSQGFNKIVVNIHHFGEQIVEFLSQNDFGVEIRISDECGMLLDTGGGILNAKNLLVGDGEPFLIHNVDILSNADLAALMAYHKSCDNIATLLVSNRESSRKLISDAACRLKGWHNLTTGDLKPLGIRMSATDAEYAFSGIHVMSQSVFAEMLDAGYSGAFPIMDFYLDRAKCCRIGCLKCADLELIDIGKPETLQQADNLFL